MKVKRFCHLFFLALVLLPFVATPAMAGDPIKIGIMQGLSGPYEVYAKAEVTGFKMGLEYFTKGTNRIIGRDVKLVIEDTRLKPARGKMLLTNPDAASLRTPVGIPSG